MGTNTSSSMTGSLFLASKNDGNVRAKYVLSSVVPARNRSRLPTTAKTAPKLTRNASFAPSHGI
ncbi:hypothetical protein F443_13177, partial [Phytophthora nicotianae P1569]